MNLHKKLIIATLKSILLVSLTSTSMLAREITPKEYEIFAAEQYKADFNKLPIDIQNNIKQDYNNRVKLASILVKNTAHDSIYEAAREFKTLDVWSNRIAANVKITDAKLNELYEKQDLKVTTKYKIRNILVKSDDEASIVVAELSKYTGVELQKRFIELVKEKSIDNMTNKKDGDGGWIDISTMSKDMLTRFQDVLKISFVRLNNIPEVGTHIILIEDIEPEHKASLDEAKGFLTKLLIQNEISNAANGLLLKDAKNDKKLKNKSSKLK